jgi:Asp-tRNA(Asn)/Glu-tRNA(Gln) amidotransferase B subunit
MPHTTLDGKSITMAAAKFVYKQMKGKPELSALDIVEQHDLWMVDEWTHVGLCCLVCLDSPKLVESFKKNPKILDSLLGKVMKLSNMTVDPELVKELLPLIIEAHF